MTVESARPISNIPSGVTHILELLNGFEELTLLLDQLVVAGTHCIATLDLDLELLANLPDRSPLVREKITDGYGYGTVVSTR